MGIRAGRIYGALKRSPEKGKKPSANRLQASRRRSTGSHGGEQVGEEDNVNGRLTDLDSETRHRENAGREKRLEARRRRSKRRVVERGREDRSLTRGVPTGGRIVPRRGGQREGDGVDR